MTPRALEAIVRGRLYVGRRTILYASAAAAIVGFLAPPQNVTLVIFCSLLGTLIALDQTPGRYANLDRCEQSAPLFGRELARAKALVPAIAALICTLCYALGQLLHGSPAGVTTLAGAPAAVVATTLVALCATIRAGAARAFYLGMAAATAVAAYALGNGAHAAIAELVFCAIVAYVALRQYGEALARYDPV